ncbi:MAG: helix-hairpin-helix domain-containing protein, partial [Vicinamibacterales bacterium]|jgi:competence protein ComEA|nr:helix-hairpin-helix domain-containing protein [Vicinamibacterales bacterium]
MKATLMVMALAFAAALGGNLSAQNAPPASTAVATVTVNINTATAAQFEELPGIGATTAERIVEFRQKNGPFRKIEELMNVKGIGEKSFLKLKPYLTVGTPKPEKPGGAQP